jgi:vitamin B12 transporter
MKYHSLAVAISCAITASTVFADTQDDENEIEKMVVVSSRVAMPLRQIATSVSVVSKEDIDARGYANLAEVLKTQPSIGVTNSGGIGSTAALRVRGEEGYRTLVRIDGVDISDPTGTQVQPLLAHIQSANVSRVEILRGSQGLMYGADAGGVVNVQSGNYSAPLEGSISGELGRYSTRNLIADVGGTNEQFDYYLSASDFKTDGFNSSVSDTSQDKDGYDNTTIHSRFGFVATDELKLGLVLRNSRGDGQFDNCGFGDTASNNCATAFEQSNIRADINYSSDSSEHGLAYAKTLIERENFNQGTSSFFTKGQLERAEYLAKTELNTSNRLVYGVDWEKESITSAQQSRISQGYYLEYQGELAHDFYFTAGVRHDDNEDFGEHTSFRLSAAYIWALGEDELKLRSAYGTGFRAPSLFEIEYNSGPFAYAPASNTTLQEEKNKGYELAAEYSTAEGSRFEIVYFDQKIDDSIFFDLATFSGYLQDEGQSLSKGLELITEIKISEQWLINANYTYNDTEDTEGEQRSRRPKHIANIGFSYQLNALSVSANVRLVKDFTDNGVALKDYELFDLSARYQVNKQLVVFARIENLLDREYQDLAAFNTQAEAPHIGLKYHF